MTNIFSRFYGRILILFREKSIEFSTWKKNQVLGLEDHVYAVDIREEQSYGTRKKFVFINLDKICDIIQIYILFGVLEQSNIYSDNRATQDQAQR